MARYKKWVPWEAEAKRLRDEGKGWWQIGKILRSKGHAGANYFTVRTRLDDEYRCDRNERIRDGDVTKPLRKNALPDETIEKVSAYLKAGWQRRTVARMFGLARTTIRERFPPELNGDYNPRADDIRRGYVMRVLTDVPPPPPKKLPARVTQPKPPALPKPKRVEPIKPRYIVEPERIVVEQPEARATTYVRRNYKFGMPIQRPPRIRNVTGYLLGDPDHPSMRVATNQRSHAE